MAKDKEYNPFTDIALKENPSREAAPFVDGRLMRIGLGNDISIYADQQGLWIGGKLFSSALWKVSAAGLQTSAIALRQDDYAGGTSTAGRIEGNAANAIEGFAYCRLNYGGTGVNHIRMYSAGAWRSVSFA